MLVGMASNLWHTRTCSEEPDSDLCVGGQAKANMSVGESFAFLAKSPYIRDLATLVCISLLNLSLNVMTEQWHWCDHIVIKPLCREFSFQTLD